MSDPFDWSRALTARPDSSDLTVVADLSTGPSAGANRPFPALLSDNRTAWVKPVPGNHGYGAAAAELVVAGCGSLIGAPVCHVEVVGLLWIDEPLLTDRLCTASVEVARAVHSRTLDHRANDDNSVRHAGAFALWDWLIGKDSQWLYSADADFETYSYDHGLWFPDGPAWATATLPSWVDAAPTWPTTDHSGLSALRLNELAGRLEALDEKEIASVVARVPSNWPVTDGSLIQLGLFVYNRAAVVAAHLRELGRSV